MNAQTRERMFHGQTREHLLGVLDGIVTLVGGMGSQVPASTVLCYCAFAELVADRIDDLGEADAEYGSVDRFGTADRRIAGIEDPAF